MSKFDLNNEELIVWRDNHYSVKILIQKLLEERQNVQLLKTKIENQSKEKN